MNDEMADRINEEKSKLRAHQVSVREWSRSAFSPHDPIVGVPTGEFGELVASVLPNLPKKLWQPALVGRGPDGLLRVAFKPDTSGGGLIETFMRRRPRRRAFHARAAGGQIVITDDGSAGYHGRLRDFKDSLPEIIATGSLFEWPYGGTGSHEWLLE